MPEQEIEEPKYDAQGNRVIEVRNIEDLDVPDDKFGCSFLL